MYIYFEISIVARTPFNRIRAIIHKPAARHRSTEAPHPGRANRPTPHMRMILTSGPCESPERLATNAPDVPPHCHTHTLSSLHAHNQRSIMPIRPANRTQIYALPFRARFCSRFGSYPASSPGHLQPHLAKPPQKPCTEDHPLAKTGPQRCKTVHGSHFGQATPQPHSNRPLISAPPMPAYRERGSSRRHCQAPLPSSRRQSRTQSHETVRANRPGIFATASVP